MKRRPTSWAPQPRRWALVVFLVAAFLSSGGAAQANTATYSCTWNQRFSLSYGGGQFGPGNLTATNTGTYTGAGAGTCVGTAAPTGDQIFEVSDSGTWSNTGINAYEPYGGVACDNVYPLNHLLNGQATIDLFSGGHPSDQLVVPYALTEAGSVVLTANGAHSNWYPSEKVAVNGIGAPTGSDSCPNTWFQYSGTLHIITAG